MPVAAPDPPVPDDPPVLVDPPVVVAPPLAGNVPPLPLADPPDAIEPPFPPGSCSDSESSEPHPTEPTRAEKIQLRTTAVTNPRAFMSR